MQIQYNFKKANIILNDLSALIGVNLNLLDTNYTPIASNKSINPFCKTLQKKNSAKRACRNSDMQLLKKCSKSGNLEAHICHAGLYDFAMPLKKDGITAGFLIFGQVKSSLSPATCFDGKLEPLYNATRFLNDEKINCIKNLLPLILFDDVITITYDSYFDSITEYISNNIKDDLSLEFLCKKFHVSKNYLYSAFHKNYDSTVNNYITNERLRKAKTLLKETNKTVYKIAEEVGIANYTYFCRLFKRKTSLTPTEYRKLGI